jgi:hypothetical protein
VKRGDEVEAEAAVLVARLIVSPDEVCDTSDRSLVPLILRRAAVKYEHWLRTGVID